MEPTAQAASGHTECRSNRSNTDEQLGKAGRVLGTSAHAQWVPQPRSFPMTDS